MRKSKKVEIKTEGRDKGKTFLLTEMSAFEAEAWGMEALGVMARAGQDIPENIIAGGLLAFKLIGLRSFLAGPWSDVSPLLERVMGCVQIVEGTGPRALIEEDIEEVLTITKLRDEVLELHLGFSLATDLLGAVAAISQINDSGITQTSATESASSSARGKRA